MFSLISFTRQWASVYKPMQHGRKDARGRVRKRFMCIENIAQLANFAKELQSAESPFVAVETNIGGTLTERFMSPEYNVYFFVMGKGKLQDNDGEDADTKQEAMEHAVKFLMYLRQHKEEVNAKGMGMDGASMIDTDNVRFETFGPFMNRWFCVGISLFGLEKMGCINPDDYVSQEGQEEKE